MLFSWCWWGYLKWSWAGKKTNVIQNLYRFFCYSHRHCRFKLIIWKKNKTETVFQPHNEQYLKRPTVHSIRYEIPEIKTSFTHEWLVSTVGKVSPVLGVFVTSWSYSLQCDSLFSFEESRRSWHNESIFVFLNIYNAQIMHFEQQ